MATPITLPRKIYHRSQPAEMTHNVFQISYLGPTRNRVAILVEPRSGTGDRFIFAVKGNIQHGDMTYGAEKAADESGEPDGYFKKVLVGFISKDRLKRFEMVCEAVPPPTRQFNRHGKKLYPDVLIRRSKEWVEETLMVLREYSVLESPENMFMDGGVGDESE